MAGIEIKCPHCHGTLQGQKEWIGMEVDCPLCQKKFTITAQENRKMTEPAAKNGGQSKKKLYISCAAALVLILVVVITIFSVSNTDGTKANSAAQADAKPKIDGISISFQWGYLLDDLDTSEIKLTKQSEAEYIETYIGRTYKENFVYSFIIEESSRKIQTIFSEDNPTIDAFIRATGIMDHKYKENEAVVGYLCRDGFLAISKADKNKRIFSTTENISSGDADKYMAMLQNIGF